LDPIQLQKKAKVVSAELDPDHTVQFDRTTSTTATSWKKTSKPANKLSNYWRFVTQWVGQAMLGGRSKTENVRADRDELRKKRMSENKSLLSKASDGGAQ